MFVGCSQKMCAHSQLMWVCSVFIFSRNVGPKTRCSRAEGFMLSRRYSYGCIITSMITQRTLLLAHFKYYLSLVSALRIGYD